MKTLFRLALAIVLSTGIFLGGPLAGVIGGQAQAAEFAKDGKGKKNKGKFGKKKGKRGKKGKGKKGGFGKKKGRKKQGKANQ